MLACVSDVGNDILDPFANALLARSNDTFQIIRFRRIVLHRTSARRVH